MPLTRVYSGDFRCPKCDDEFRAQGVPDDELVCPTCDEDLDEIQEEDEVVEEDEEDDD